MHLFFEFDVRPHGRQILVRDADRESINEGHAAEIARVLAQAVKVEFYEIEQAQIDRLFDNSVERFAPGDVAAVHQYRVAYLPQLVVGVVLDAGHSAGTLPLTGSRSPGVRPQVFRRAVLRFVTDGGPASGHGSS